MAFFDMFKKKDNSVTCARCGAKVAPGDAKQYKGQNYCASCYSRAIPTSGGNTEYISGSQTASSYHGNNNASGSFNNNTSFSGGEPAAIQDVKQAFDKANLKYHINHVGNQWEVVAGVNGKANTYQVKFIAKDGSKNDLALRVFALAHFPQDRRYAAYPVLNKFQQKYRFIRFNLDRDGDVNMEYDLPSCTSNVGACAVEMLLRTMKMVDEIYPDLMRSVWA